MWLSRIIRGDFEVFALLDDLVEEHNAIKSDLKAIISSHTKGLIEQFLNYFPEKESKVNNWIRNAFSMEFMDDATSLPLSKQEALIDPSSDKLLKDKFTGQPRKYPTRPSQCSGYQSGTSSRVPSLVMLR